MRPYTYCIKIFGAHITAINKQTITVYGSSFSAVYGYSISLTRIVRLYVKLLYICKTIATYGCLLNEILTVAFLVIKPILPFTALKWLFRTIKEARIDYLRP